MGSFAINGEQIVWWTESTENSAGLTQTRAIYRTAVVRDPYARVVWGGGESRGFPLSRLSFWKKLRREAQQMTESKKDCADKVKIVEQIADLSKLLG